MSNDINIINRDIISKFPKLVERYSPNPFKDYDSAYSAILYSHNDKDITQEELNGLLTFCEWAYFCWEEIPTSANPTARFHNLGRPKNEYIIHYEWDDKVRRMILK